MTHLVLAIGNPLRQDDGFAAALARTLAGEPHLTVKVVHQLTPELAEPISRAERVVFVDAAIGAAPGELRLQPVRPDAPPASALTHYVTPEALLLLARAVLGRCPPATLVTVTGSDFGYGEGLSAAVEATLPAARKLILEAVAAGGASVTVEIVDYRPGWPAEFAALAAQLRRALGDLALRIDHIGSTSVPDLPAKDIIDIQITVAALDDTVVRRMTAIGFRHKPGYRDEVSLPDLAGKQSDWQKLLFVEPAGARRANIHVRVQGRPNQRYALLFRDYLRCHSDVSASYAKLKRLLAGGLRDSSQYASVKDPAVDIIYFAASAWAETAAWQPGPSDA